jgi:hypothetical protein
MAKNLYVLKSSIQNRQVFRHKPRQTPLVGGVGQHTICCTSLGLHKLNDPCYHLLRLNFDSGFRLFLLRTTLQRFLASKL